MGFGSDLQKLGAGAMARAAADRQAAVTAAVLAARSRAEVETAEDQTRVNRLMVLLLHKDSATSMLSWLRASTSVLLLLPVLRVLTGDFQLHLRTVTLFVSRLRLTLVPRSSTSQHHLVVCRLLKDKHQLDLSLRVLQSA